MKPVLVAAAWLAMMAAAPVCAAPEPSAPALPARLGDADIARLIRYRVDRQHRSLSVVIGVLRPGGVSLIAYGPKGARGARRSILCIIQM